VPQKLWGTNLLSNMDIPKRLEILTDAKKSPNKQLIYKELCRKDPIFFINHFAWTYDPRRLDRGERADVPFVLYPYQEDFIRLWQEDIEKGRDFLIEKSRDMGASWMIVTLFAWYWMFVPGANFHIGSRKQEEVDNAQVDPAKTLFGKIRYLLEKMPPWIISKQEYNSKHLALSNLKTGNLISGESANSSFGRGGRYTAMLFDELAFWEFDEAAWAAASQSTRCRIALSTPYGESNKYARLALDPANEKIQHPEAERLHKLKVEMQLSGEALAQALAA
jgi:phage terminase large subunit